MRSYVSLFAALAAAPLPAQVALPPEAGTPAGPSGTAGAGEPSRYDAAVWAEVDPALGGLAVATGALPAGSHAEVTALSSGRTVLLPVVAGGVALRLSPAAAQALGVETRAGVRIRAVTASPADAAALRRGESASPRLDAPEAVLRALRRQLPALAAAPAAVRVPKAPRRGPTTVADVAPPPPTALRVEAPAPVAEVPPTRLIPPPSRPDAPGPAPTADTSRFVVQVRTLPREEQARNLARTLHGAVQRVADGWQVRLGPYTGLPAAQAARDDAVSRGYADAAIFLAD